MCLGIPGRIVEIWHEDGATLAHADFDGQRRRICLNYLPELAIGDYTIVHAGFALTRLDEAAAMNTLQVMRNYGIIDPVEPGLR